jgi:hypothetical protein
MALNSALAAVAYVIAYFEKVPPLDVADSEPDDPSSKVTAVEQQKSAKEKDPTAL